MRTRDIVPGYILTVTGVLSPAECATLVADAESRGFERAPLLYAAGPVIGPDRREGHRAQWRQPHLAAGLWRRLRPFIPANLDSDRAVGLNDDIRLYRYDAGQRFSPHRDDACTPDRTTLSRMSLVVYLDDDFRGGVTAFRHFKVQPRQGMALLFRHELEHEPLVVQSGTKHVLRSDVLYRRGAARVDDSWPVGLTTGRHL